MSYSGVCFVKVVLNVIQKGQVRENLDFQGLNARIISEKRGNVVLLVKWVK